MRSAFKICAVAMFALLASSAFAGGPIAIGGPAVGTRAAFGVDGQAFTWNPANMPIKYRLDPGPMASDPASNVVISNADGAQRVQAMFGVWQSVSTASVSFINAGAILPAGSYTGGDLLTMAQYNDVAGSCKSSQQNPVIFDANGSILSALGLPPEVIGFTSICALDPQTGYITGAMLTLNGKFQDGVSLNSSGSGRNYEITANQFDEAITHEIGHFIGLGHSQLNIDLFKSRPAKCDLDSLAGLPLMFPIEFCQARKDVGLPLLSPDDLAWVSKLYPSASQVTTYGTISGRIYFSDGVSQFQGANVIARRLDDPSTPQDESLSNAVSVVSGFLFTGNPGQSVTANMTDPNEPNTNGYREGSRNPQLIGYYEIPVPAGVYTVQVESVYGDFASSSGVGPLPIDVAVPNAEYWNLYESAFDIPLQRDSITVKPGDHITNIDIILNATDPRYDDFEDGGALLMLPPTLTPDAPAEVAA